MPYDLDPADLDEVRCRVVDRVLAAAFRPGELDEVVLVFAADEPWPGRPAEPGPREVRLRLTAGGEGFQHQIAYASFFREDADECVERLVDALGDWLCETAFAWAERRLHGVDVAAAPPRPRAVEPGLRVIEVVVDEPPSPLWEDGRNVDPAELGLPDDLVADLRAWRGLVEVLLRSLAPEPEPDPVADAAFGSAAYASVFTVTFVDALPDRRPSRLEADAQWREVVDVLESGRDDLLERLRAELGPGFHVPTPPRVPR